MASLLCKVQRIPSDTELLILKNPNPLTHALTRTTSLKRSRTFSDLTWMKAVADESNSQQRDNGHRKVLDFSLSIFTSPSPKSGVSSPTSVDRIQHRNNDTIHSNIDDNPLEYEAVSDACGSFASESLSKSRLSAGITS